MRINATYIGANKSAGYFTGQSYALQVLVRGNAPEIVYAEPPGQVVPYASWRAFWRNWKRER